MTIYWVESETDMDCLVLADLIVMASKSICTELENTSQLSSHLKKAAALRRVSAFQK